MKMAIIGGKLQGTEVAYLAREAGYETLLVDRNTQAPASGLVDRFVSFELADSARLREIISGVDLVFPAIEDLGVLTMLSETCEQMDKPVVLDLEAYKVSCSKLRSNELFEKLAAPMPVPFPACGLPAIAKPCFGSGSVGVRVFERQADLDAFLADRNPGDWCVQQFVEGPSYSLEVIGRPGAYQAIQVTELFMDDIWDCRKVLAPAVLPADLEAEFRARSLAIAEALQLKGIMDVEVILAGGTFYFLEIDARFPSQTPIAVYHSTGINMVRMLADLFVHGRAESVMNHSAGRATLEHVWVTGGETRCQGEHVMSHYGPLHVINRFSGAERAITSYSGNDSGWVATLINRASTAS